jgi:hypothetical protein
VSLTIRKRSYDGDPALDRLLRDRDTMLLPLDLSLLLEIDIAFYRRKLKSVIKQPISLREHNLRRSRYKSGSIGVLVPRMWWSEALLE